MKYHITGSVTGSKYVGMVEADSKEEAIQKAWDELDVESTLCHQCSSECEDPEIRDLFASEAHDAE